MQLNQTLWTTLQLNFSSFNPSHPVHSSTLSNVGELSGRQITSNHIQLQERERKLRRQSLSNVLYKTRDWAIIRRSLN